MWKINKHIENISKAWNFDILFGITYKYSGMCLFTAAADEKSGMNIVGINPVITINGNSVKFGKKSLGCSPLELMDRILSVNRSDENIPLLLGYIAYDFKDSLEESGLYNNIHENLFPDIRFSVFEYYLCGNNSDRNSLKLIRMEFPFEYDRINIKELFNIPSVITAVRSTSYISSSLNRKEFKENVEKIKEYILSGDIYQANLTRKIDGLTEYSPLELAVKLKNSNSIEFGVFARIGDKYVLSTTPERFFKIETGVLYAYPVKGTIRRSADEIRDSELLDELLKCPKNKAELAMITDLLRNDMNKICTDVTVKGFPLLMKLKNVYHLYSEISGVLKKHNLNDIFKALFPAGSITGCPKIRACQIIEELEKTGRGLYTGNFGYINFNGNADFNIMIRTLFYDKGHVSFNTGGGITLLSDPEDEYRETVYKAKNIYDAVNMEEIWEERYCLTEK